MAVSMSVETNAVSGNVAVQGHRVFDTNRVAYYMLVYLACARANLLPSHGLDSYL